MGEMKRKRGITLVALVITVIILLILAGITLGFVFGKNGIIGLAQNAGKNYVEAENEEGKTLNELYSSMMVATNDSATVTISVEELNKLIDSRVEAKTEEKVKSMLKQQNPTKILEVNLENTLENPRSEGTYNASTSFTKTTTNNYETYLQQNEDGTWTVKKSGFYFVTSKCTVLWNGSASSVINGLIINGEQIRLCIAHARNAKYDYDYPHTTTTVFLSEGTKIDFYSVVASSPKWQMSQFVLYAMFE